MDDKRTAYAYVQLTVQVSAGSWGPQCTLAQATEQAIESARSSINSLFKGRPQFQLMEVKEVTVTFNERHRSCPRCGQNYPPPAVAVESPKSEEAAEFEPEDL